MDGWRKKMKRSGPKWCLIPPLGNDGTYVTQMTVRVTGLFVRLLARSDRLDRQSSWRLRERDRLNFYLGEKSG